MTSDAEQDESSQSASRLAPLLLLALLMGLAVLFRFDGLGHLPGVNGDEAWMGTQALAWLEGEPVETQTPTGNVLNVFHFAPQVVLHAIWEPSFALLRAVALVSSLLALCLNFWLARKVFGDEVAFISTALLTLLPINIAYARFGWDASQSVLFVLPVLYLPLVGLGRARWRWLAAGAVCLAAAVVVHPTNIFAAPLVVVPAAMLLRRQSQPKLARVKPWGRLLGGMVLFATVVAVALLLRPWVTVAGVRLVSPDQWGAFLAGYLDFLAGTTVYRFISGSAADGYTVILGRCGVLLVLALAAWGLIRRRPAGPVEERHVGATSAMMVGVGLTLFGFFLVAGPEAIRPHFERYAMCLVAGSAALVAVGLNGLRLQKGPHAGKLCWGLAALACLWLLAFQINYLGHLKKTGGESHRTFQTAGVDPKQAALEEIIAQRRPDAPLVIVATQWWNYWPLKYLSYGYDDVEVIGLDMRPEQAADSLLTQEGETEVWFVEFHDSPALRAVCEQLEARGFEIEQTTFDDYDGTGVVTAGRLELSAAGR